jgi:hypothetical protein
MRRFSPPKNVIVRELIIRGEDGGRNTLLFRSTLESSLFLRHIIVAPLFSLCGIHTIYYARKRHIGSRLGFDFLHTSYGTTYDTYFKSYLNLALA